MSITGRESDTCSAGHRFVALDSLRGLCAIFVAIYHFSAMALVSALPFIKNGFLFVDFFFVLSGFVIAASYGDRLQQQYSISKFMFLRLGRLYPLHGFVLFLYLCVAILKPHSDYSVSGFFVAAFLLQTFSENHLATWNAPSWSISAELWTYVVFATLARLATRRLHLVLGAVVIASPTMLMFFSDRYIDVCFGGSIFRCLFGFGLGAAVFSAFRKNPFHISFLAMTIIEALLLVSSMFIVSIAGAGPLSFVCPFVFASAVFALAYERGLISRLLSMPQFRLLGALSYSIYMVHMFVQARLLNLIGWASGHLNLPIVKQTDAAQTIMTAPGFEYGADATIILMLIMVIGFAFATFKIIEEPCRLYSRRLASAWWSKAHPPFTRRSAAATILRRKH